MMIAYLKNGEVIRLSFDNLDEIPEGTNTINFDYGVKAPSNTTDKETIELIRQWRTNQEIEGLPNG